MSNVVRSAVQSALRPGVSLDTNDGSVNVVARLSDIARGEVAGYNASVLGSFKQLFPRLSRKDYEKLAYTELPDAPVSLAEVLGSVPGLREKDLLELTAARRLVRQVLEDGSYRDVVVPNVKNVVTEMDLLDHDEMDGLEMDEIKDLASRKRVRTYTLTQVMSDGDVKAKYSLPARTFFTGERLAATDAPAAAKVFQDAMNAVQDHTRVRVVAGLLAIDNVQAANAIRMLAYGTPPVPDNVRCDIIAGKVFLYAPDGAKVPWYVLAPAARLPEALEVYRVVCALGPTLPSGLLSVDLVQLKIDIFDGETHQEPVLQFNAAVDVGSQASAGLSGAAAREMTAAQRAAVSTMGDRLVPIKDRSGRQLATAVRVTDKHVLMNDHVYAADTAATLNGRRVSLSYRVARDVWSVECPGTATPWMYREPEVGESVIILYMVDGKVSCTSPIVVELVNRDTIMTSGSADVVQGVSGGALIALKDFSFFGIHSASVGRSLLNYRFGSEQLEDLVGCDAASSVSRVEEGGSFASEVVRKFSEKGLGSTFRSICASVVSLWDRGAHAGMGLVDGQKVRSTVDVGSTFTSQDDSVEYHFSRSEGSVAVAASPWTESRVPLRRRPRLGEKVFIVGRDGALYVTDPTEVAHVYGNSKGFVLKFIPGLDRLVTGGAVVGWDGAVLGLAESGFSFDTPVGQGLECRLLPLDVAGFAPSVRSVLTRSFPYLGVDRWTDGLLEEVFTHATAGLSVGSRVFNTGNRPLAALGDAYLTYLNLKVLREHDVAQPEWGALVQSLQSPVALAPLAHKFHLDVCVRVGEGVVLEPGSLPYAELVRALVGGASLVEPEAVVVRLCGDLGVLYDGEGDASVVQVSEAL